MESIITLVVTLLGTVIVSCISFLEGSIDETFKEPSTHSVGGHSTYIPTDSPTLNNEIFVTGKGKPRATLQDPPSTGERP